jgi:hypothetical protein
MIVRLEADSWPDTLFVGLLHPADSVLGESRCGANNHFLEWWIPGLSAVQADLPTGSDKQKRAHCRPTSVLRLKADVRSVGMDVR